MPARVALVASLAIGAASLGRAQDSGDKGQPHDDKGEQKLTTVCTRCHPIERVTASRRTKSQWEEVITTMITSRGAQVSDEEFEVILAYLTREYGRVLINRAPADDLVEVLGISDTIAGAIVSYRKEHGPFEDFDALAKVPGIDREQLEKKREALIF
jgi:competence ComEA-like helix-hairpin-helix protein